MSKLSTIARYVVNDIMQDMMERGGLSDEWEYIDPETQDEIIECWIDIVEQRLFKEGL
jgi:hypothetical protein